MYVLADQILLCRYFRYVKRIRKKSIVRLTGLQREFGEVCALSKRPLGTMSAVVFAIDKTIINKGDSTTIIVTVIINMQGRSAIKRLQRPTNIAVK